MSEFKQEDRYLILKRSDIYSALSPESSIDLYHLAAQVCEHREKNGKPTLEGVVIEKNWEPLYSHAWNSIKRVNDGCSIVTGTIAEISEKHHAWVEIMGWKQATVLESLALIASEVGEAVNECRGERPTTNLRLELADICLRVFDLAERQNIDLLAAIEDKMGINSLKGSRGRVI